jgi:hypothetical protein
MNRSKAEMNHSKAEMNHSKAEMNRSKVEMNRSKVEMNRSKADPIFLRRTQGTRLNLLSFYFFISKNLTIFAWFLNKFINFS